MERDVRAELAATGLDYDHPGYRRECGWPGCSNWWHACDGPHERGWIWARTPGRMPMCPAHVATGHLPNYRVTDGVVTFLCGCGLEDVRAASEQRGVDLIAWWSTHVGDLA